MNIAALQTFVAVLRAGHLNKAAAALNVTQSTVTARLDALEDALGQRLLVRSRRGAQLTRAGFAFQRHAELMLQSWEQANKAVGLPMGYSGLLSFACHVDLWEGAGSGGIEAARRRQPELAVEVWPGEPGEIGRWLSSGLSDAALVLEPLAGPGLAARELTRERLVQVASRPRRVLRWDPDYIYVDLGPEFRRQHSRTWSGEETARVTFGLSRWALDHLLAQGGSAYLPWRLAEPRVKEGRLHPVEGAPEFSRPLHLVWREASLASFPWIQEIALPAI